ncbi:MAG: S8 family serine peptidase [Betaproteobacteria bacterium]
MPRFRTVRPVLLLALAITAWAVRGRTQTPSAGRTLLQTIGLPAVDRGVLAGALRGPANPAVVNRPAVRSAGAIIDRIGASGGHYVPGRLIVKFRDGTSTARRLGVMAALSGRGRPATMRERPSYADFDIVRIDPNADAEEMARVVSQRSDVEYAQADYRVYPRFVPNDRYYGELQWNLPLISMERAWDIQPQAGSDITVAVLDTGMAYENVTMGFHADAFTDNGVNFPALGDVRVPFAAAADIVNSGRVVSPHDFIWDDNNPVDLDGHGTHVSGTIGELTNNGVGLAGVAFNVKLMPVKVIDSNWDDIFGSPEFGSDEVVARGIRYAVDNGAKILNMSIGRTGAPAPVIEDAVNYAVSKGAFVAIAGGNDFEDGNTVEVLAEIASRVQGAVSVAAVDRAKQHAFYSNTGSYIELAAPGGSDRGFGAPDFGAVWQETYDYTYTDTFKDVSHYEAPRFDILAYVGYIGTSMAVPHVSGVAAMLMQQGITDPKAIEAALELFADDLGNPGRDDTFGYGLINAQRTLRGLGLAK